MYPPCPALRMDKGKAQPLTHTVCRTHEWFQGSVRREQGPGSHYRRPRIQEGFREEVLPQLRVEGGVNWSAAPINQGKKRGQRHWSEPKHS